MQAQPLLRQFLSRHGLVAGLLLLFLVLSFSYAGKVSGHNSDPRSAILRWQNQVLDLWQGDNIWETCNYPNPPIMAVLLTPLMHLPPLACALTWFYLKAGMAILAILWVFRMVETQDRRLPAAGKVLAVLLSVRAIAGDLTHGNINLFILFLLVAALYAFYRSRDLASGLLLALAVACKLTPALFIPYFLWKRAWRTLAGCVLGLALFFGIIPGLFLGMSENAQYLTSWTETMIRPFLVDGAVTSEHNNQSLPGLVFRLASRQPSFSDDRDGYVPLEYHNLIELDRHVLNWFLKSCMLLFALTVVWSCRTPIAARADGRLLAEFSLICLGMLLFSERTWKHHCVTLLLPFSVIAYHLFACRPDRKMKRFLITTLVLVSVLILSTGTSGSESHQLGKLAQLYGAYVWAYLLSIIAVVRLLRLPPEPAAYHIMQARVPSGLKSEPPRPRDTADACGSRVPQALPR